MHFWAKLNLDNPTRWSSLYCFGKEVYDALIRAGAQVDSEMGTSDLRAVYDACKTLKKTYNGRKPYTLTIEDSALEAVWRGLLVMAGRMLEQSVDPRQRWDDREFAKEDAFQLAAFSCFVAGRV